MATLTLQCLLDAIEKSKTEMLTHINSKVDPIQTGLANIQTSLYTLGSQVELIEGRISTNESNIDDLTERVKALEAANTLLREKMDDQENRLRRSNLRVVGIPESAEGADMIQFMSQLIPSLLGRENFPSSPVIERAHRSPTQRPKDRDTPRPIIMKMLNFQDKMKIIRLARAKRKVEFNGSRVYFNPDLSADLARRHKSFANIKRELRDRKIKYFVRYPCTLCVSIAGKEQRFDCPEHAEAVLKTAPNSPDSMC